MGVKDRYPKPIATAVANSSASVKSASSSLNSPSPLARQLSVVHESPNIDIASAINLLQELKKTASPEELVALHRALLPVRESQVVVDSSSPHAVGIPSQSSSRRSSRLPPGLNTRGEPGDDLLRKLGDEVSRPRTATRNTDSPETIRSSKRASSATYTHAPEHVKEDNEEAAARPETPSDHEYLQTGAYRQGTLRITNGAASPEPGRVLQQAVDPEPTATAEAFPDSPASFDFPTGRPVPESMESFPGVHRILHSEQRRPSRPLPPPPEARRGSDASDSPSQDSERQFYDAYQEQQHFQESLNDASTMMDSPLSARSQNFPQQQEQEQLREGSSTPKARTPTETSPSKPQETKGTVGQFASRLSTVYGEDDSEEDVPGTPNDALAKLTGEPRLLGPREPRSVQSVRSMNSQRPASLSHVDSGYGSSDTSLKNLENVPNPPNSIPRGTSLVPRNASTHKRSRTDARAEADTDSLYTFTEFLSSQKNAPEETPSVPISPISPTAQHNPAKKDLPSFLGLKDKASIKRMSLPAGNLTPDDSTTSLNSSVVSERTGRTPNRLRKAMPEKLKREKSFRVSPASEISTEDLPTVSQDMHQSLKEKFHKPASASEKDELNRRASMASQTQSIWDDGTRDLERENERPAQRKNPFQRKRSMSRGRKSQPRANVSEQNDPEQNGRFDFLRSLSRSRSRRRASIDSADCRSPARADFGGSGSVTPKAVPDRDASTERGREPWRTGPAPNARSKSRGMTEEMASELARSKSRDVAGHDRVSVHDRPRMATPKKSSARSHARSPSVGPPKSGRMVEDFVPGWHSKESSPQPARPAQPELMRRPYSMYADSIPPMPEIPVDVAAKAAMAGKLKAKKKKDSPRRSLETPNDTPRDSPQTSAASSPKVGMVKRAVMAREEQERRLEDRIANDREAENLLHPVNRAKQAQEVHVGARELQGSESEQSSLIGQDSRPPTADHEEIGLAKSPPIGYSEEQPDRQQQADLWRERRKSLGTYLPNSSYAFSDDGSDVSAVPRLASPEIVVSRYITPLGNEIAARARNDRDPTSEAARHADSYRSLLDDEDLRPTGWDIPRTDSAYSSASSNVTVPKHQDLPHALQSRPLPRQTPSRTVSGLTTASSNYSQYSALPRTRSPGGRVRTPSGNFYAYEPANHASQAERSRTASLGKLHPTTAGKDDPHHHNGTLSPASSTDGLSTIFSDTLTISSCGGTVRAKPKDPHQRHRFPEPKYQHQNQQQYHYQNQQDQQSRARSKSKPRRPRPVSSHSSNLADRYSGGLAWEWDRQSGFGGSAGTRISGQEGTRRKGQMLAHSHGVDLGDVPIFVCQSPDGLTPAQQERMQRKGYFAA